MCERERTNLVHVPRFPAGHTLLFPSHNLYLQPLLSPCTFSIKIKPILPAAYSAHCQKVGVQITLAVRKDGQWSVTQAADRHSKSKSKKEREKEKVRRSGGGGGGGALGPLNKKKRKGQGGGYYKQFFHTTIIGCTR